MSLQNFSASQISHITAGILDNYQRGEFFNSGILDKPLVAKMEGKAKKFHGGKESLVVPVKFETGAGGVNDGLAGMGHNTEVAFYEPGNGLQANYVIREHHLGMALSESWLKKEGVLVGDTDRKMPASGRDPQLVRIVSLVKDAVLDFNEQTAKTLNTLFWGDGTADSSALHGLRAFIQDIPTTGVVGGLSAVSHPRWRNYAFTAAFNGAASFDADYGGNRITVSASNGGALLTQLQSLWRLLRKYGGRPDCFFAGSDFIEGMELEIRANGNYSDTGFTKKQDGAMGEMFFKGVPVIYDPTLDDLGRAKYAYIWDSSDIYLSTHEGDWRRQRVPARPYNKFVFHQSLICTGQMCARRRNSAAVVEIA